MTSLFSNPVLNLSENLFPLVYKKAHPATFLKNIVNNYMLYVLHKTDPQSSSSISNNSCINRFFFRKLVRSFIIIVKVLVF